MHASVTPQSESSVHSTVSWLNIVIQIEREESLWSIIGSASDALNESCWLID